VGVSSTREERGLGVSENEVLRRIFGSMREKVSGGGWRKLLHTLYSSPVVVTMIKSLSTGWVGTCRTHERDKKYVQNFNRKNRREDIIWET